MDQLFCDYYKYKILLTDEWTVNFSPSLGKFLFRKKWAELRRHNANQEEVLIPLIRERKEAKERAELGTDKCVFSYVESLLELELPEEKQLSEKRDGEFVFGVS